MAKKKKPTKKKKATARKRKPQPVAQPDAALTARVDTLETQVQQMKDGLKANNIIWGESVEPPT